MPPVELTPEQNTVLDTILANRLTIVRAGPGSGKTRVFVEALKRFLETWTYPRKGVAALSFTNVAQSVITDRLGGPPGAPHFVGTIDSFLLRFVVRPFGQFVGVSKSGGFLVPAPVDESLSYPLIEFGPGDQDRAPLYRFIFKGGDEATPTMTCRDKFGRSHAVPPAFAQAALKVKRKMWAAKGLMTHSDSHYLAASLLKGPYRDRIADLVSRRFPVILVDEFQDTGWFLGRALIELLRTQQIKGAVVGDPDQAIYQFGGASGGVFADAEALDGSIPTSMPTSHRCSRAVGKVASILSRTSKEVVPKDGAAAGKALLIVHSQSGTSLDAAPLVSVCAKAIDPGADATYGVLARRRSWVRRLILGDATRSPCPWQRGMVHRLSEAARFLSQGEPTHAARAVRNAMTHLVFDDEAMSGTTLRERLSTNGITLVDWRKAVHTVLMEAVRHTNGETWNGWVARMKGVVDGQAVKVGWTRNARTLGSTFKARHPDGDVPVAVETSPRALGWPDAEVMTVHSAKGREFDVVLVVVPKPHGTHAPCPSTEWWSDNPGVEEREVAFVACSRAKEILALAVHRKTYDSLCRCQRGFVDLFEVHEVGVQDQSSGN